MSIASRFVQTTPPAFEPAVSTASDFSCPHYTPVPGSKRCKDYQDGGTCAREDFFLCTEWERRNRYRLPQVKTSGDASLGVAGRREAGPSNALQGTETEAVAHDERRSSVDSFPHVARDLFGNPLPEAAPPPAPKVSTSAPIAKQPAEACAPTVDVDQLRGFTAEDIASFKALGVEVLLRSETYGDVWLVPAYTGRERTELTPEHAATIARVMSVFPGSHIVSFEKTTKTANPERQERPLEERS